MSSLNGLNGSSQALSVSFDIKQETAMVEQLQQLLKQIRQDLQEAEKRLKDAEKSKPDKSAFTDKHGNLNSEAYGSAYRAWEQRQLQPLQQVFDRINAQMASLMEKIEESLERIEDMQKQDLPDAQRDDAKAQEQQLKALKQELEAAAEAFGGRNSEAVDRHVRREILKGEHSKRTLEFPAFTLTLGSQSGLHSTSSALQAQGLGDVAETGDGAGKSASAPDNLVLRQSGLTAEDEADAVTDKAVLTLMPRQLREPLRAFRKEVAQRISGADAATTAAGLQGGLQQQWSSYLSRMELKGHTDVAALVQWVLRESYMETTEDLRFYAEKVKFYNDVKKMIRKEIDLARDHLSQELKNNPNLKDEDKLQNNFQAVRIPTSPVIGDDGRPTALDPRAPENIGKYAFWVGTDGPNGERPTKQTFEKHIEDLEGKLNSVGDDAQLANVDLQNILQKQQQTLQLISNVSKMLHDTAMAIIRKIGG